MCRMSNGGASGLSLEDPGLDGQTPGWMDRHQAGGPESRQTEGRKGRILGTEHGFKGNIGFQRWILSWRHPETSDLEENYFLHLFVPVL